MIAKIKTKKGTETIDTENRIKFYGAVYESLKNYFNEFINDADAELQDMYFGSFEELNGGSYLDWRGAVEDMFNGLCEYLEDTGKTEITTKEYFKIDFEGLLQ